MNKHILFDNITASAGGLIAGKKKFFANSVQSPSFAEHVEALELECPSITGALSTKILKEHIIETLNSNNLKTN